MPKTKGLGNHPIFKLGKDKARRDKRNLQLRTVLTPAPVPDEYDYDLDHPGIPTPMFANDRLGDCVIAGRAHATLRFENFEQKGAILAITDRVVVNEYLRQTGGNDNGLVMLDSLSQWRQKGWRIKSRPYRIQAFAEINRGNHTEVKRAIIANIGVYIGLGLPITAQDQFQMGQPWEYVGGSGAGIYSWGGHCVYCSGYTTDGPICVTWGRKQQMTWGFWNKYCDEGYAVIDRINKFRKTLNTRLVEEFLQTVTPVKAAA